VVNAELETSSQRNIVDDTDLLSDVRMRDTEVMNDPCLNHNDIQANTNSHTDTDNDIPLNTDTQYSQIEDDLNKELNGSHIDEHNWETANSSIRKE
jgi:hypothetical protein